MAVKKRHLKAEYNCDFKNDQPKLREPLFSNRTSLLDVKQLATENELSTNLTGFIHFYWITLTFFIFSTLFVNWFEFGYLLSGNLMKKCFRDAEGVVIGELIFLAQVISAGFSLFVLNGSIEFIRYSIPISVLFVGSFFGFYRQWSGLQRSIYLLHSLSVFMKIYAFLYHHRCKSLLLSEVPLKFKNLFYFAFAPTMIYSEKYPKSKRYLISNLFLGLNCLEFENLLSWKGSLVYFCVASPCMLLLKSTYSPFLSVWNTWTKHLLITIWFLFRYSYIQNWYYHVIPSSFLDSFSFSNIGATCLLN